MKTYWWEMCYELTESTIITQNLLNYHQLDINKTCGYVVKSTVAFNKCFVYVKVILVKGKRMELDNENEWYSE